MTVKTVVFEPILALVSGKLEGDRKQLVELISDPDKGVRDFDEQDRLIAEIQAGARTIDVLLGACDLGGNKGPVKLPRTDAFDAVKAALEQGSAPSPGTDPGATPPGPASPAPVSG